eukprot:426540-Pleurochrysis_carterae.AAC.1
MARARGGSVRELQEKGKHSEWAHERGNGSEGKSSRGEAIGVMRTQQRGNEGVARRERGGDGERG